MLARVRRCVAAPSDGEDAGLGCDRASANAAPAGPVMAAGQHTSVPHGDAGGDTFTARTATPARGHQTSATGKRAQFRSRRPQARGAAAAKAHTPPPPGESCTGRARRVVPRSAAGRGGATQRRRRASGLPSSLRDATPSPSRRARTQPLRPAVRRRVAPRGRGVVRTVNQWSRSPGDTVTRAHARWPPPGTTSPPPSVRPPTYSARPRRAAENAAAASAASSARRRDAPLALGRKERGNAPTGGGTRKVARAREEHLDGRATNGRAASRHAHFLAGSGQQCSTKSEGTRGAPRGCSGELRETRRRMRSNRTPSRASRRSRRGGGSP